MNLHVSAVGFDAMRKWVAVRLADGSSDGTLYDKRRDAVRHQPDEQLCAYICIAPGGMKPCAAEAFMQFVRMSYDAGMRLVDPDDAHGGRQVIPRLTREDHRRQVAQLRNRR